MRKALALLGFCLILISCTALSKEKLYRKSAIIMNTLVTITVSADSKEKAEGAIEKAFEEIRRLEKSLSFWSQDSEISAISLVAGSKGVKVSARTLDVVEKALFVSGKTGGAFDATVGPLMRLYDFKRKTAPDENKIKERLPLVNWKEVIVNRERSTVYLSRRGMSFDTGGIAKGYAVDRAVETLKTEGIKAGLVAIAGDIRAFGIKPDGEPWLIGIRNPRPEQGRGDLMATVALRDEAISTSGDYERYFMRGNVRYHHILDPRTGRSATGCQSVSVIAGEATFTDGFSTGIFVMGPEKGMGLLKEMGFEALIVGGDGRIYITEGIKGRVRMSYPP